MSDISQKGQFFLRKEGTKNFTIPYLVPFLNFLHQNVQKKRQYPIARCINGLD